jgi:18S rRNA (adenine1779-N6/adenine1780-N6)-dimethyltransferase
VRLLFNRKNKTLRASLITKSVLKLLEENRRTLQSLQPDKIVDDGRPIQSIVEDILERESWKGQRASKLDLDDFLQLLQEFNEAGIHFS